MNMAGLMDWFVVKEKKTSWGKKFEVRAVLRMGKSKVKVRNFKSFYDYNYPNGPTEDDISPEWSLTRTQMKKLLRENPEGWKIKVNFYFDPQIDGTAYGDEKYRPLDVDWLMERLNHFDWNIVYNFETKTFEIYDPAIDSYTLKPPTPVYLEAGKDKAIVYDRFFERYEIVPKEKAPYYHYS
ncbi:protein of unknown function (plasmid) [Thermococcus nautili]|nr:protein of unknown function [Thermococcus nautili]